jgi:hypothetical protein
MNTQNIVDRSLRHALIREITRLEKSLRTAKAERDQVGIFRLVFLFETVLLRIGK